MKRPQKSCALESGTLPFIVIFPIERIHPGSLRTKAHPAHPAHLPQITGRTVPVDGGMTLTFSPLVGLCLAKILSNEIYRQDFFIPSPYHEADQPSNQLFSPVIQLTRYSVHLSGFLTSGSFTCQLPAKFSSIADNSKWHIAIPMSMR
jgi:hypothetical protein